MKITIKHITRKMSIKTRRNSIQDRFFKVKIDVINVETQNTLRDSNALPENPNAETVTNLVISVACVIRNKNHTRREPDHLKHTK